MPFETDKALAALKTALEDFLQRETSIAYEAVAEVRAYATAIQPDFERALALALETGQPTDINTAKELVNSVGLNSLRAYKELRDDTRRQVLNITMTVLSVAIHLLM